MAEKFFSDYRGFNHYTENHNECLPWDSKYIYPKTYFEQGLRGNYCRNPDGIGKSTWCYTSKLFSWGWEVSLTKLQSKLSMSFQLFQFVLYDNPLIQSNFVSSFSLINLCFIFLFFIFIILLKYCHVDECEAPINPNGGNTDGTDKGGNSGEIIDKTIKIPLQISNILNHLGIDINKDETEDDHVCFIFNFVPVFCNWLH